MRKLFIPIVLGVALSAGSAGAQIVTKLSGIQPLEHPSSYAEKFFAEQVSVMTNGAIKVENYHNTQLGDAVANVQSIRNGTIGFTVVSASNLNQVVPAMDMLSLPFIFKNAAHFWWYTAQQTGVVDGAENNHPSVVAKKFYEVSKFYTLDEHMRIPDLLIVSTKFL